MTNPPSIPEQIATIERQIKSLRDSFTTVDGDLDPGIAREVENMESTILLLRWMQSKIDSQP